MENLVAILENDAQLSFRMQEILKEKNIFVLDADNTIDFFFVIDHLGEDLDLVILDLCYEEGLTNLLQEVREKLGDTPVVVLTYDRDEAFLEEAVLAGATDFIFKPVSEQAFRAKVYRYLNILKIVAAN